ncbi:MAG: helix-turn-helix domain-containing protein [Sulfuritalea sp.]|nr:helix-turn-helix domain-containing protein [Sulfuritalea sp.]
MKPTHRPKKASSKDWHPADIVAALHKRGITLRQLAGMHDVSHTTINKALRGRCAPSEKRISDAIGIAAHKIWPSRYYPDGTRKGKAWKRPFKGTNSGAEVNVCGDKGV